MTPMLLLRRRRTRSATAPLWVQVELRRTQAQIDAMFGTPEGSLG
jgi:hypothetical protein